MIYDVKRWSLYQGWRIINVIPINLLSKWTRLIEVRLVNENAGELDCDADFSARKKAEITCVIKWLMHVLVCTLQLFLLSLYFLI